MERKQIRHSLTGGDPPHALRRRLPPRLKAAKKSLLILDASGRATLRHLQKGRTALLTGPRTDERPAYRQPEKKFS